MRGTNVSIKCGCAQISASSVCTNVSDLQRICDTSKQLHRFSSVHRWSKDSRHRTTAQHRVPAQMPVTSNGCHTAASNPALCRHLQTILLYADISNQFCLRQTPPNNPACGRHLQCNKTGNFIQCRNWKRNTLLKSKTDSEASRPNNKSCFSVEISESKTCFPQNSPPAACWSKANFPVECCPVWNWEETLQVALGKLRRERIPTPDGTFSTNFLSSCWSHSGVSTYRGEGSQVIKRQKLKIPLPHHNNPDQCV